MAPFVSATSPSTIGKKLVDSSLMKKVDVVRELLKTATAEEVNWHDEVKLCFFWWSAHAPLSTIYTAFFKIFTHYLVISLQDGYSALLWASGMGHTETVMMLLGHPGIDVNLLDKVLLYFSWSLHSCPIVNNSEGIFLEYPHYWCYIVTEWKFSSYHGILGRTHRDSEDTTRSPWYRCEFTKWGTLVLYWVINLYPNCEKL